MKRGDEGFVFAKQQLADEPIERVPRVDDRLPAHAVAGVEQHAEADRDALVGELRDVLRVAVFEDLEVVFREPGDQPAVRVGDGDGDLDDVDARSERTAPSATTEATKTAKITKNTRRVNRLRRFFRWSFAFSVCFVV